MKKSVSMKTTRKLFWSFMSVLFALSSLITASYAWFSMNSTVSVTGMSLETKVENNLAIASSTEGVNKSAESNFKSALHQTVSGLLQPVSSVDGVNFFYTYEAAEDGQKVNGNYAALESNTITTAGGSYKGYVDYVFELKATNTGDAAADLKLTKLNLLYAGTNATTKAFRVAVFVQGEDDTFASKTTEEKAAVANAAAYETFAYDAAHASIFALADSVNFTTGQAVASATTLNDVLAATAISRSINKGATKYFKITVRLWLEGEDKDCYNTKFISLNNKWTLDLKFELGGTATAITTIGAVPNAELSASGDTLTASLTNGEAAATYAFYKVGESTPVQAASATATYTMSSTGDYYCVIVTAKGNEYYTPIVHKN